MLFLTNAGICSLGDNYSHLNSEIISKLNYGKAKVMLVGKFSLDQSPDPVLLLEKQINVLAKHGFLPIQPSLKKNGALPCKS